MILTKVKNKVKVRNTGDKVAPTPKTLEFSAEP